MATVIDSLVVTLGLDPSKFQEGGEKVKEGLKTTREDADRTAKDLEVAGKRAANFFTSISKSILALAGVALSANGVKNFVTETTKSLVDLGVQSSALGLSEKALDGWTKSAEALGSSASSMTSNLQRFQSSLSQFNSGFGTDDTLNTLFNFGAQTGAKFNTNMDPGQVMKYLADNWNKLNKNQQRFYGQQLNLDNATIQGLQSGRLLEVQKQMESSSKQTEELNDKARRLNEQFVRVRQSWESTSITLYANLLPAVNKIIGALDDMSIWVARHGPEIDASFSQLGKTFDILWADVKDASRAIGELLDIDADNWSMSEDIANLNTHLSEGRQTVEGIIDAFKSLFNLNFSEFGDKVKGLFKLGSGSDNLPAVSENASSAADWIQEKTGFDPRSVGNKVRSLFFGETARLEKENGLPPGLLDAQVEKESSWNPAAISKAGAKGLMQIMPGTAEDLGIAGREYDPLASLTAGARHMGRLLKKYNGDLTKALSAYNWGEGNVDRKGLQNAPAETRNYAGPIIARMQSSQRYAGHSQSSQQSGGTHITFQNTTIKTDANNLQSLAKDAASKGISQSSLTQTFMTGQNN